MYCTHTETSADVHQTTIYSWVVLSAQMCVGVHMYSAHSGSQVHNLKCEECEIAVEDSTDYSSHEQMTCVQ